MEQTRLISQHLKTSRNNPISTLQRPTSKGRRSRHVRMTQGKPVLYTNQSRNASGSGNTWTQLKSFISWSIMISHAPPVAPQGNISGNPGQNLSVESFMIWHLRTLPSAGQRQRSVHVLGLVDSILCIPLQLDSWMHPDTVSRYTMIYPDALTWRSSTEVYLPVQFV